MKFIIILLIFASAAAVLVLIAQKVASHKFRCARCDAEFSIKPGKAIITEHSGNEYMLTCPHCGVKDWCVQMKKQ